MAWDKRGPKIENTHAEMDTPMTPSMPLSALPHVGTEFLTTKLHIPKVRAQLIPRAALVDVIEASSRPLVLLCAQAGYGKSTLVVQWLARVESPVAWVSLDQGDNEPNRFFRLIVAALQTIDRGIAVDTASLLDGQGLFVPRLVADTLARDLDSVVRPFILVLDDYHVIDAPAIHDALGFLLQQHPSPMRVVLVTRSDPPLALGRLRAHDRILELRDDDLRFTREEALDFLQTTHGLDPTSAMVDAWTDRTEGWVAGLQLVAQAMRGQSPERAGVFAADMGGNVRFVNDYLWEEALQRQPESIQYFLLRTSILDRFNADLCNAVVGITDASDLLRRCERANLFLIPLDNIGQWYRFHHLFADVLRDRLADDTTDDELGQLHRRAADWLETHGLMAEAVRHAVAGRDWDRAIRLLDPLCADLFKRDRLSLLRSWLEGLPSEVLERSPRLAFWLAWALGRAGRHAEARAPLEIAERAWTAADDRAGLGAIQVWHAHRALVANDTRRTIDCARSALTLLSADQLDERLIAQVFLGYGFHFAGEPVKAEEALAIVRGKLPTERLTGVQLGEMTASAGVLIQQGLLQEATVVLRRAIRIGDPRFALAVQQALLHLGNVHLEWNMLDEADRYLHEADELAELAGAVIWRSRICLGLAKVAWARGDTEAAFEETERSCRYAEQMGTIQEFRNGQAQQARFWLSTHQIALGRRWANSCELDPYLPPAYERHFEHLTYVRLLIREGHPDVALRVLAPILQLATATGRTGDLVELNVLRAVALKAEGANPDALIALERGLSLGEASGYIRTFVNEGDDLVPLLRHLTGRSAYRGYAQRLLAVTEGMPTQLRPNQARSADALSDRELDVLRLVAAGLPNRDIGGRLFISEKTVKKHISNIFGKLGATNRTQAVDQARRLDLL